MNIHKPMVDYDALDIKEIPVYNKDTIKRFKELEADGYEVVFWLPWHDVSNRFIGIKYFMAKPQSFKYKCEGDGEMSEYRCVECFKEIAFPVPVVADLNESGGWGFRAACPKCGGQIQSSASKVNK